MPVGVFRRSLTLDIGADKIKDILPDIFAVLFS